MNKLYTAAEIIEIIFGEESIISDVPVPNELLNRDQEELIFQEPEFLMTNNEWLVLEDEPKRENLLTIELLDDDGCRLHFWEMDPETIEERLERAKFEDEIASVDSVLMAIFDEIMDDDTEY